MNCAPPGSSVDDDFTKQGGVVGGLHSTPVIPDAKQNGTVQDKDLGNSAGMNNAAPSQPIGINNAQSNHLPPMQGIIIICTMYSTVYTIYIALIQ